MVVPALFRVVGLALAAVALTVTAAATASDSAPPPPNFVRIDGNVLRVNDETLQLRGYNLGNWLLLEDFMIGLHGAQRQIMEAVDEALGERARIFWRSYENHYFTAADAQHLRQLGVNLLRVPLNQNRFEDPNRPGVYDESAFQQLDRVIQICRAHGIYVLIDLHAVFGGQSREIYADTPSGRSEFWTYADFRKRATDLWVAIARRYAHEATVAGYDILNEPQTEGRPQLLEAWYREVVPAVRAVDPHHVIWLSGDDWGKVTVGIPPEYIDAPGIALQVHAYPSFTFPRGLTQYPGEFEGVRYDKEWLKQHWSSWVELSRRKPVILGEFGLNVRFALDSLPRRACEDFIRVADELGWSWAIWTYKDAGAMSLVSPGPATPWLKLLQSPRTQEIRTIARELYPIRGLGDRRWDTGALRETANRIASQFSTEDFSRWAARAAQRDLEGLVTMAILQQTKAMTDAELEALGASFAFEHCVPNPGTAGLFVPAPSR